MRRITVLERGRIERGGSDADEIEGTLAHRVLPAWLYDRLMLSEQRREDGGESAVFAWRRNHCLVGQWVGVLQIPGLQIEILPKITDNDPTGDGAEADIRSNLMEMLMLGGLGAVRARGLANLAVKRGTVHDQLVDTFLDRTIAELRRGLDRGYASVDENLATLRGKLVLSQHVTKNAAQKTRFFCRHDVLTEGTPISLRLKQACRVLAARTLPLAVSVKCQQVLALLDDVPDQPYRHREPDPAFTRQNERFADIYTFACVLLEGQAPDARRGEVETFSLLFDMEKVFERYIAAFVAREVMPNREDLAGVSLHPQGKGHSRALYRNDAGDMLRLKPDLLFVRSEHRFIIDTKWKRLTTKSRPTNADLYQLYAYLRRFECTCVCLLYPKISELDDREFKALGGGDQKIGVLRTSFVDLDRKLWTREGKEALAKELGSIVRLGLEPEPATEASV